MCLGQLEISRILIEAVGVNFFDFVNRHRATEARRLLVHSDLSVLEIGLEVGFNSRSTFNAAFKKHVGSSPSAYRAGARNTRLEVAPSTEKPPATTSE
jgi:AraC-like DNA-binding protein